VTIQKNRRTKPRVVHIDILAPVKKEFDGSWIHTLSRRGREPDDEDLLMVPELFRSAEEEATKTGETPATAPREPTATPMGPKQRHAGAPRTRRGGRFMGVRAGRRPVTRSQRVAMTHEPG
jgi:hypothetical protein